MNVIWAHPSQGEVYTALVRFITGLIWGDERAMTDGTIMAVADSGNIVAACLFHNWDVESGVIEMTSASTSARWLSRAILREMFSYPFEQLGCQAVIARVDPENTRMCRIASAFGGQRHDIPRLRGRDKAEALFILGDDEWRAGRFH